MGETTTISVEPETLQRFKEAKAQLDGFQSGVPDHSADSFLNALLDTLDAHNDGYYDDDGVPTADDFPTAEDHAREVAANIDYAELATRTADELEARMS